MRDTEMEGGRVIDVDGRMEGCEKSNAKDLTVRSVARFNSLSDDVVPLGPISILGRLESSLKLRQDIDQNLCRILL